MREPLAWLVTALLPLGALAAGSVEPAGTNEIAPGGPGRLCMRDSSLDLLEEETVRVAEGGLHGLQLEITGPAGQFTYAENEIFAEPRTVGEPVAVRSGFRVTRQRRAGEIAYLFYGPIAAYRDGQARPVVWIRGEALVGRQADLALLARVRIGPPEGCALRYDYGFEEAPTAGNAQ